MGSIMLVGLIPEAGDVSGFQNGCDTTPRFVGTSYLGDTSEAVEEVARKLGREGTYFAFDVQTREVRLTAEGT